MLYFLYIFYSFKSCNCRFIIRAYCHSKGINYNIFCSNAIFCRSFIKLFYDCDSSFCCFWNSAFIKCKSNYNAAVFFYKRKNRLHDFLFSINWIYQRFSIIKSESAFHCNRIRRINLKRKISYWLQFLYDFLHHCHFINFRETYIYVKDVGTFLILSNAFVQNVWNVVLAQRFLEFFLSSRVNALTNKNWSLTKSYIFCAGRNNGNSFVFRIFCIDFAGFFHFADFFRKKTDMFWCGTTATAKNKGALLCKTCSNFRKSIRSNIIDCSSVFTAW